MSQLKQIIFTFMGLCCLNLAVHAGANDLDYLKGGLKRDKSYAYHPGLRVWDEIRFHCQDGALCHLSSNNRFFNGRLRNSEAGIEITDTKGAKESLAMGDPKFDSLLKGVMTGLGDRGLELKDYTQLVQNYLSEHAPNLGVTLKRNYTNNLAEKPALRFVLSRSFPEEAEEVLLKLDHEELQQQDPETIKSVLTTKLQRFVENYRASLPVIADEKTIKTPSLEDLAKMGRRAMRH